MQIKYIATILLTVLISQIAFAAIPSSQLLPPTQTAQYKQSPTAKQNQAKQQPKSIQDLGFKSQKIELSETDDNPIVFDIPISYNTQVQKWINYYQTRGRKWFQTWLERSHDVLPLIQKTFKREGLPQDLAYMAMIESGFSSHAVSTAYAVGPWQFIRATGERFGLRINWWLDERKDFDKSTQAAAKYIAELNKMFGSWYLVAAAYNTGETRVRNLIKKHGTKNFWELVNKGAFVEETENYIPKLIAATLVSKAPKLYGFKHLDYVQPPKYDFFSVPGGTRMTDVADQLGVTHSYMKLLNPELLLGYVPSHVSHHRIRIPKGAADRMVNFIRQRVASNYEQPIEQPEADHTKISSSEISSSKIRWSKPR